MKEIKLLAWKNFTLFLFIPFFTSFIKQNYKKVKNSKAQVCAVFFKNLNFSPKLEGNFCAKKCDFSLKNNFIPLCMVWQCPKLKMSFTRPH